MTLLGRVSICRRAGVPRATAEPPVFQERRDVRPAQDAGLIGIHLRLDLLAQTVHLGPVPLWIPVVLLVVAVIEPEKVVEPVIGADGIGVVVARLDAIVFEIALRVA